MHHQFEPELSVQSKLYTVAVSAEGFRDSKSIAPDRICRSTRKRLITVPSSAPASCTKLFPPYKG